jgi:Holliday junction DNA helicase RuvB
MQQGFLERTARGRMATRNAYKHLGLTPTRRDESQASLLDE